MDTVWLVDDLPRNLRKFEENHRGSFKIETFSKVDEVLDRIHKKDYPDALLCDVFFYDSVELAEQVEAEVAALDLEQEIAVGRGHDTNIDVALGHAAAPEAAGAAQPRRRPEQPAKQPGQRRGHRASPR